MDWTLVIGALGVVGTFAGVLVAWYAIRKPGTSQDEEFTVEGHPWVMERFKGDYVKFLRELLGLDHEALPGLTDAAAGSAETKSMVFEKSADTWALVVSRNRQIVGYWSFFSLSDRLVRKLKKGIMLDSEIVQADVHQLSEQRPHILYFEMFGIRPSYDSNHFKILRLLLGALNELVQIMQANGVRVAGIYANGFTDEGAALCRNLGLKPIRASAQKGDIFFLDDISIAEMNLTRMASRRRFSIF